MTVIAGRRRRRARTRSLAVVQAELATLEEERQALRVAIATVIGPRVMFSSRELWAHRAVSPALAAAFDALHLRSARQLGKRLRHLGLTHVGDEGGAALWLCE